VDRLPQDFVSLEIGENGYRRGVAAGSWDLAGGALLAGAEIDRSDGPWTLPQDLQKWNGVLRWSRSTGASGISVDAMAYRGEWNSTDQIPLRAVESGAIGRFDAIDPTTGGESNRYSLSAQGFRQFWHRAARLQRLCDGIRPQTVLELHLCHRRGQRRPVRPVRRPARVWRRAWLVAAAGAGS
jgi:hypothetical protein